MRQEWFTHFGWKDNPFKIQPNPDHIIGFIDMRSKILSYVHSHSPFMIIGPTGSGKTTLLLWTKSQDGSRYVYHNFLNGNDDDLKKRVKGNVFQRLGKKDVVALLDEAQDMSDDAAKWLRASFDNGDIKSLVVAAVTKDLDNLQEPLLDRIGSRMIETRSFDEKEAEQFVRQRIYSHGKHNPFDDDAFRMIFKKSNYQPRRILENCELLCMRAAEYDEDYIGPMFVSKYLGTPMTKETIKDRIFSTSSIQERLRERFQETVTEKKPEPAREPPKPVSKPEVKPVERKINAPNGLSPAQLEILKSLMEGELTTVDIADKINGNRASVAKQLSRLSLKTDVKTLKNKGITKPLVETKGNQRPVMYRLTTEGKKFV